MTRNRNQLRTLAKPANHRRRGAIAMEYILILVLVVLPLALMLPLFLSMIGRYGSRVLMPMPLPFP